MWRREELWLAGSCYDPLDVTIGTINTHHCYRLKGRKGHTSSDYQRDNWRLAAPKQWSSFVIHYKQLTRHTLCGPFISSDINHDPSQIYVILVWQGTKIKTDTTIYLSEYDLPPTGCAKQFYHYKYPHEADHTYRYHSNQVNYKPTSIA